MGKWNFLDGGTMRQRMATHHRAVNFRGNLVKRFGNLIGINARDVFCCEEAVWGNIVRWLCRCDFAC